MRARRSPAAWTAILVVLVLGCGGDDRPSADPDTTTHGASESSGTTAEPPGEVTTGTSTGVAASTGGSSTGGLDGTGTTDVDGTTSAGDDTSTGVEICEAPTRLVPCDALADEPDPFQAIGLGCPLGPDEAIPLAFGSFQSADPQAFQVATRFGTHDQPAGEPTWGPRHGEQLLVISSGYVATPDAAGAVTMDVLDQDANDNPDDKPLPAPMSPVPGSGGVPFQGCDGVGDCSDSLWGQWLSGGSAANDLLWFQLRTEVPGGTHGFTLDFAWFSEEYPESVGTTFNDMLVVWSQSETYVGNLCLVDEEPCTVTGLWPVEHQGIDPELDGTGFSITRAGDGGAMGWSTLKGSAAPHELLELTVALFDMGDEELDTLVLLDAFGWDCEGCTPTPENPCGVVR
jgi:hypothetical protein